MQFKNDSSMTFSDFKKQFTKKNFPNCVFVGRYAHETERDTEGCLYSIRTFTSKKLTDKEFITLLRNLIGDYFRKRVPIEPPETDEEQWISENLFLLFSYVFEYDRNSWNKRRSQEPNECTDS